ncbi:hypothetical protein C1882_18165 [Pseudomonas sp. FW305-E2]|uniref:hypothetical protein n=1 Tax=Pseudomonas sp. FW305-E2 TaxID=2075558 RepID=UPI000B4F17C0|nr:MULTISPECIES: hypothetical protein [Pseudomonas]POA83674.1 hypothetical protein C1882_18165 [Pseudomonas sp. FW305-E2]
MSRFAQQHEIYIQAQEAFRLGDHSTGLRNTLYLMANFIVGMKGYDLYRLWEASVIGGNPSEEIFGAMVDGDMIVSVLQDAKDGKVQIVNDFLAAVQGIEINERERILKAVV